MRRRMTILALFCAFLLTLPMARQGTAVEIVCFTAVNDSVLPLMAATMPTWHSSSLYIPYTVFHSNSNGGLDLYCTYSTSKNTVTIYNTRQILVFDLTEGNCVDMNTLTTYDYPAIIRNGTPYVPASFVCSIFKDDLTYTYRPTDYGMLLRITSSKAVLSFDSFVDAAGTTMNAYLRDYRQSLAPPTADPPPTTSDPTPSNPNQPPEITEPSLYLKQAVLAFRWTETGDLDSILTALQVQGVNALFLFPVDALVRQDDLIRRMVGEGHSVGLDVQGATGEESLSILEQGSAFLSAIARLQPNIVLCPEDQWEFLERQGWLCWKETASAAAYENGTRTDYEMAYRMVSALSKARGIQYLTLSCDREIGTHLGALLRQLRQNSFTILQPLEIYL